MINITEAREGAITKVKVTVDTQAEYDAALEAFRTATNGRQSTLWDMEISARCNKRELSSLLTLLSSVSKRFSLSAPAAQLSAPAKAWRHRELISVGHATREAPATVTIGGETMRFTGYGRLFIASEIEGPQAGDRVRYAYYA